MDIKTKQLAVQIRNAIQRNTMEGFDKDGKPFKAYSTNPFSMPYYAIHNKDKFKKYFLKQDDKAHIFRKQKTGKMLWVLFKGGYSEYKKVLAAKKPKKAGVNLFYTGQMIEALKVLSTTEHLIKNDIVGTLPKSLEIKIGWSDAVRKNEKDRNSATNAQIAYYNKLKGRDMFGIPEKLAQETIQKHLKEKAG